MVGFVCESEEAESKILFLKGREIFLRLGVLVTGVGEELVGVPRESNEVPRIECAGIYESTVRN